VKKVLELLIVPNSWKKKEFSQSLNNIGRILQHSCSSLKIDESDDDPIIHVVMEWETVVQMRQMFSSEDFNILSGAITSLCEEVVIRMDGNRIEKHISTLHTL